MMEVCGPEAVYCLLKAAHAMFRAQQVSTPEHTDASLGPMLEQKIWVWHVLHVAESQGRFSGLGDFVLFCTLCFVLFNLCAVCMNELLSIFREPGSEVPSLYLTQILSWTFPATSRFQLSPLANGSVPARGCTKKRAFFFCSRVTT